MKPSVRVRDPRALRALAHPLRNTLLGLLRLEGPATATQLGRRVGENSGSTSYHLRQLAQYGFVEELPDRGNGRERWWQATHRMTSWQTADFPEGEAREVADEIQLHVLDVHHRLLDAYAQQRARLPREFADLAELSDYVLRLRPEQLQQLSAELNQVLRRYVTDYPGAQRDGELVSVQLNLLPLKEYPL